VDVGVAHTADQPLTGGPKQMSKFILQRSMATALADLLAEYQRNPSAPLARKIELIRDEIQIREAAAPSRPSASPEPGIGHEPVATVTISP
jgi:hypothetical protein